MSYLRLIIRYDSGIPAGGPRILQIGPPKVRALCRRPNATQPQATALVAFVCSVSDFSRLGDGLPTRLHADGHPLGDGRSSGDGHPTGTRALGICIRFVRALLDATVAWRRVTSASLGIV